MNYNLSRFLKAQEKDYETALAEIRAGRKRSHWIWYIFPQLTGLGYSHMADYCGWIIRFERNGSDPDRVVLFILLKALLFDGSVGVIVGAFSV